METYCTSCKKYTVKENSSVRKTKQNRLFLSNCAICGKKKSTFFKNKEFHNFNNISDDSFKMNKTINRFLWTGDRFMAKLHLKQPEFTYSACGPFTKQCKRTRKLRESGKLKHLYRNNFDKGCFAHDPAHSDGKDLAKRTVSDNIMKDRAFEIARNHNYDG